MSNFRPAGLEVEDDFEFDGFEIDGENNFSQQNTAHNSNSAPTVNTSTAAKKDVRPFGFPRPGGSSFPVEPPKNKPRSRTSLVHTEKRSCETLPRKLTNNQKRKLISEVVDKNMAMSKANGFKVTCLGDMKMAILQNNMEALKCILDQDIEVDAPQQAGWTALMYAANASNSEAVKMLLDKNADPNYHKDQYTVLMAACSSRKVDETNAVKCVEYLVEKGADVNARDRYHLSPIICAAREGQSGIVRRLGELGANKDDQDSRGYTALMWAATRGHLHVVHTLMTQGADVTKRSTDGCVAMDLASMQGNRKICELLESQSQPDRWKSVMTKAEMEEAEEAKKKASAVANPKNYMKYGDMETFLTGLELGHLIETFREQNVLFVNFLKMTDQDFQQMGITQIGTRKKLLDAIRETHKRSWETSSLTSVQYNKKISCGEAIAMVGNIKKHAAYIASTIGYVADQVKADESILKNAPEGAGVSDLCIETEEAVTNVRNLFHELVLLRTHIGQLAERPEFHPPDLLVRKRRTKSKMNGWSILGVLGAGAVIGLIIWRPQYLHLT